MSKKYTSESAIKYLQDNGYPSYYSISKALSDKGYKVQGIQISQYARGLCKMSTATANKFLKVFDIHISDTYSPNGRPPVWT